MSDEKTFLDRGDEKRTSDSSNIAPAVPSLVHVHKLYQLLLTPPQIRYIQAVRVHVRYGYYANWDIFLNSQFII